VIPKPNFIDYGYVAFHDKQLMGKFFRVAKSIDDERQLISFRKYCALVRKKLLVPQIGVPYVDAEYSRVAAKMMLSKTLAF
jgi:hypothetical protein